MDDDGIAGPDGADGAPVGWAPPGPGAQVEPDNRPPSTARRVLDAAAWIVGILGVLFLGRVYAAVSGPRTLSAEQWGTLAGGIVVALLIGLAVRWLVVRIRHRGRVRSPWILVVAVLVLLVSTVNRPPLGGQDAASLPIDTYLQVGAPYTLAMPTADETDKFKSVLTKATSGVYDVRRVLQDDKVVGFFVIADLDTQSSPEFRQGVIAAWVEGGDGAEAHEVTVGNQPAVVGTRASGAAVLWVEPPYGLTVYAIDPESGQRIAAAIMAANQ